MDAGPVGNIQRRRDSMHPLLDGEDAMPPRRDSPRADWLRSRTRGASEQGMTMRAHPLRELNHHTTHCQRYRGGPGNGTFRIGRLPRGPAHQAII